ncbi:MAG: helix-turn-helix transcriptional regulator [bacterium]
MPDIIDNVKVGEYIKSLLKKKGMTQDDLAEALSISKAAVSQNLRGKSSFDIQNLIQIAKIFEITLDDLLNLKSEGSNDVVSEYQKVVSQGIEGITKVPPQDLHIAEPDLYGKVLVDYIIEQRKLEMLLYLIEKNVEIVHDYYHRAKNVYLRIIKFLLEEKKEGIDQFIDAYTKLHGSFLIDDETIEMAIWGYLNTKEYQNFMIRLMKYKPTIKAKWFKVSEETEQIPLTRSDYIKIIAKYHLSLILKTFIQVQHRDDDFCFIVDTFIATNYTEGLHIFIQEFYRTPMTSFRKSVINVQKALLSVLDKDHYDLVIDFVDHGLYIDLTQIVREAIRRNQDKIYSHLIAKHHNEIIFKRVGETCVEMGNLTLLESIINYLSKDDLNYLISWVKINQMEVLIFLLKQGARIDEKYYNLETFKKINHLIDYLLKKGE